MDGPKKAGRSAWLFDRSDPTHRLSHVVPVATILGASYQTGRIRTQHEASPNSFSMRAGSENSKPMHLMPAHRPRPALKQYAGDLAVVRGVDKCRANYLPARRQVAVERCVLHYSTQLPKGR